MRRGGWRGIVVVVLAMAMVWALAPAGLAKKGGGGPERTVGQPPGVTCVSPEQWEQPPYIDNGSFTVTVTKGACVDLVWNHEGMWDVEVVDLEGSVSELLFVVRDSTPGDNCGEGKRIRGKDLVGVVTSIGPVPASMVNACGTEWSEILIEDVVLDDGTLLHGGDETFLEIDQPHPLAFQAAIVAGKGSVTLEVRLPSGG